MAVSSLKNQGVVGKTKGVLKAEDIRSAVGILFYRRFDFQVVYPNMTRLPMGALSLNATRGSCELLPAARG